MAGLTNGINSNSITPLETIQGGTGLSSPTTHGILVGQGSSAVDPIVLTNGELLIGSTSANPVASTLTAGSGITITNGAGSITIGSIGFDSVNVQVLTATSGTYTPTANMVWCFVEAVGGGGAGGGATASLLDESVGGGGGAGAYANKWFSAASIGASQSYSCGAAGTGGTGTGGTGGTTTFGSNLVECGGGAGGLNSGASGSVSVSFGGVGGTANDGTVLVNGSDGGFGMAGTANGNRSGPGASSAFGSGGTSVTGSVNGNAASGHGAGGSGASTAGSTNRDGGNGTAGVIYITEYIN